VTIGVIPVDHVTASSRVAGGGRARGGGARGLLGEKGTAD